VLAILDVNHASEAVSIIVQVAGFVVPALFTRTYPERVRARYADRIANLPSASQES
jgi:hypothetical protein